METEFAFLDTGDLRDGEIALMLRATLPADPERGYMPSYEFGIHDAKEGQEIGLICLRVGPDDALYYAGHIGYMVDPEYRGHHYAAKACKLIFSLARRHGMESLLITCNPDNLPSRRTCERVGGRLLEVVDLPEDSEMYLEGEQRKCVYEVTL